MYRSGLTALAVAFTLMTSSCGGGGGGSNTSPSPPAPTPPPVSGPNDPLAIDGANMIDVGNLVFIVAESVLQLSDPVLDAAQKFASGAQGNVTESCANGGMVDYLLTDADASMDVSEGDTLTITFSNCEIAVLDSIADGTWSVDVLAPPVVMAGEVGLALSFDSSGVTFTDSTGATGTFGGILRVEQVLGDVTRSIAVSQVSAEFTVTLNATASLAVTETITGFIGDKTWSDTSARYTLNLAGSIASEILEGLVSFATVTPISGYFNVYPDTGVMQIDGGGESSVTVSSADASIMATDIEFASFTYDANGDGAADAAETLSPWLEATVGFLWWDRRFAQDFSATSNDVNNVELLSRSPGDGESFSVNQTIVLQYSRPLDPATVPADFVFRPTNPGGDPDVNATVQLDGARLVVVPADTLQQGRDYLLTTASASDLRDVNGNPVSLDAFQFTTDIAITLNVSTSSVYGDGGDALDLSADAQSTNGNITGFSWTQTAGTQGSLSTTDGASTQFTLPAVAAAEELVVTVEATDDSGGNATKNLVIRAFPDTAGLDVIWLQSGPNEPLVADDELLLTSDTAPVLWSVDGENNVSVTYETPDFSTIYSLRVGDAAGAVLAVGPYEDATEFGNTNPGPYIEFTGTAGCSEYSGRFDVLEVSYPPGDPAAALAVDFSVTCEDGVDAHEPLTGSVRISSEIPVPATF